MLRDILSEVNIAQGTGYVVGVLPSDGAEAEFVFGGRCVREGSLISADTLWEAASLSKPVVALLALERSLRELGFLDSPLVTTGDEFGALDDDRWGDLTLTHALNHTTGFPNWRTDGEGLSFESDPGIPGYSGEGFELLLVELSARSSLPTEVILDRHLRFLQMTQSSFIPDFESMVDVAIGHNSAGAPLRKMPVVTARASGSLHTTAADCLHFVSAVARPDALVDPDLSAAARLMADRTVETFPGHGRTPGWAFTNTALGDVLWQHGDNPGFKHVAAARPATGEAVVVFTNSDDGQTIYRDICKQILQVDVW